MRIVLVLVLLIPSSLFADAAKARLAFGAQRAPALEALIAHIYPGSVVEWEPSLAVRDPDGMLRALRVNDSVQREDADGFTFVMPLEFPQLEREIAAAMEGYEPLPEVSQTEIFAFKTTPAFSITALRRGTLGETGQIVQVVEMELVRRNPAPEWPEVFLDYEARYGTTTWLGEIGWTSKLTTDPVAIVHRLPSYVMKRVKDAPAITEEPLIVPNEDRASYTFFSYIGQKAVSRCADPCVPDGKLLLALW